MRNIALVLLLALAACMPPPTEPVPMELVDQNESADNFSITLRNLLTDEIEIVWVNGGVWACREGPYRAHRGMQLYVPYVVTKDSKGQVTKKIDQHYLKTRFC